MFTRRATYLTLFAAISGSALGADAKPEPLRVDLRVTGAPYPGDGCKGGDWTLRWRGELPAEDSSVDDMLISYSAFDTTNEQDRVDSAARIEANPLTCRDKDGKLIMSASLGSGTRKIRGVLQLKDDPAQHSPGFWFDVDDAGRCLQNFGGATSVLPTTLTGLRSVIGTTFTPDIRITRKDMVEGFEKRYTIGGYAVGATGMCMNPQIASGELILRYKRNDIDPEVSLSGCSVLPLGQSTTIGATVDPDGGSIRFEAQPSSSFTLESQGFDARVTAKSPGKGNITAEYTYKGKSATAQLQAGALDLVSINDGVPLPKLGLLDVDGLPNNKVYSFPYDLKPADAHDMIDFSLADDTLASVLTRPGSVGLQAVKEGKTTLRAKTTCGQSLGREVEVEVVMCDDEVRRELERQLKELKKREHDFAERIQKLVSDPEFDTAAREIAATTGELITKTGEVIAATLTGSEATMIQNGSAIGRSVQGLEAVQKGWDIISALKDARDGKPIALGIDVLALALNTWMTSSLKSFIEAGVAAQKFGEQLGIISGVVDQLEKLEPEHDKVRYELYRIESRLKRCNKEPPPPPVPPKKGDPTPPTTTEPPPTDSTPPQSKPPKPTPPTDTTPPEKGPPIVDPVKPPMRGTGLCVRPIDPNAPATPTLRSLAQDARTYRNGLQTGIDAMKNFQRTLEEMRKADALPEPGRSKRLSTFAPRADGFFNRFYKLGEMAQTPKFGFEPCTFTLPAWIKDLRTRY